MIDLSITIPAKDYKLIERAIKKNRYPVEDPTILARRYFTHGDKVSVTAQLLLADRGYVMLWRIEKIDKQGEIILDRTIAKADLNHVSTDGIAVHFDIDPTYE
jgi:hypothetical protein